MSAPGQQPVTIETLNHSLILAAQTLTEKIITVDRDYNDLASAVSSLVNALEDVARIQQDKL